MDSDSESEYEDQECKLSNIQAYIGTFFEYSFNGKVFQVPRVIENRYVFANKIDKGCFGTVFDLFDTTKQIYLAIKLIVVSFRLRNINFRTLNRLKKVLSFTF
jgi:hypothetical protein